MAIAAGGEVLLGIGAPPDVLRPIQYLGSKLRSLAAISAEVSRLAPGGTVVDPFSGTSVVGQALAADGHRVLASDAMEFATTFATAMLGVDRAPFAFDDVQPALNGAERMSWFDPWEQWVELENAALTERDGHRLIALSLALPQVWRRVGGGRGVAEQFDALNSLRGLSPVDAAPLVATHYAGTFFGIRQALELDALRQGIWKLRRSERIGSWAEAVLLTALLAAASEAAFSAGKHYAQPHAIHRQKDLTFAAGRIVEDRKKDIRAIFVDRVHAILRAARPANERHRTMRAPVDSLSDEWWSSADVVYADPPYTAQQYSRFYHVPEVLVEYRVPDLELVDAEPTRGLYPEGRYKSPFSSKTYARSAFADLCERSLDAGASLVISYSASVSGETGNDRMISLSGLEEVCRIFFGERSVEVIPLEHVYRQFNGEVLAVVGRHDREYLVVCHGPA